ATPGAPLDIGGNCGARLWHRRHGAARNRGDRRVSAMVARGAGPLLRRGLYSYLYLSVATPAPPARGFGCPSSWDAYKTLRTDLPLPNLRRRFHSLVGDEQPGDRSGRGHLPPLGSEGLAIGWRDRLSPVVRHVQLAV